MGSCGNDCGCATCGEERDGSPVAQALQFADSLMGPSDSSYWGLVGRIDAVRKSTAEHLHDGDPILRRLTDAVSVLHELGDGAQVGQRLEIPYLGPEFGVGSLEGEDAHEFSGGLTVEDEPAGEDDPAADEDDSGTENAPQEVRRYPKHLDVPYQIGLEHLYPTFGDSVEVGKIRCCAKLAAPVPLRRLPSTLVNVHGDWQRLYRWFWGGLAEYKNTGKKRGKSCKCVCCQLLIEVDTRQTNYFANSPTGSVTPTTTTKTGGYIPDCQYRDEHGWRSGTDRGFKSGQEVTGFAPEDVWCFGQDPVPQDVSLVHRNMVRRTDNQKECVVSFFDTPGFYVSRPNRGGSVMVSGWHRFRVRVIDTCQRKVEAERKFTLSLKVGLNDELQEKYEPDYQDPGENPRGSRYQGENSGPLLPEVWGQDERKARALHGWVENAARKKLK